MLDSQTKFHNYVNGRCSKIPVNRGMNYNGKKKKNMIKFLANILCILLSFIARVF